MRRPPHLTGKQRRQLRSLAHNLSPVVQVGHKGITEQLLEAVDVALTDHELIKVKMLEGPPVERKSAGGLIAERVGAHDVGVIGRVLILYRRHPDNPRVPLRP